MKTKLNLSEKWTPSKKITNHDGTPIESKYLFIVPPPAEIGEILSASSTFTKYHPISLFKFFVNYFALFSKFFNISIFVTVISYVLFLISTIWNSHEVVINVIYPILGVLSLPGLFNSLLYFAIYKLVLLRKIYYLGKNGIGVFSFTHPFKKEWLECRSFLYKDIVSILIEQTHHFDKQLSTRYKYTRVNAIVIRSEWGIELEDKLKKHYNHDRKVFSNHPINFYIKANEMFLMFKANSQ